MKYLVTGSSGFVGRHLCRALEEAGHTVIRVDRNAGDSEMVICDIASRGVVPEIADSDGVFHLAANADWRAIESYPELAWENIRGTQTILDLALEAKVPLVYSSTAMVYGAPVASPVNESMRSILTALYPLSKRFGEELCFAYAQKGLAVAVARFFNIYGPGQDKAITYKSAFVPNMVRQLREKPEVLKLRDLPWTTRDFVYVGDVVDALIALMGNAKDPGTWRIANVGSGRAVDIQNAVAMLCDIMDVHPRLEFGEGAPDDPGRRKDVPFVADISQMGKLGWAPNWNLREGLQKTVEAMTP